MTYRWSDDVADCDDTVLPRQMPSSIRSRKTLIDKPRASASSASRAQLDEDEDEPLEAYSPLDEGEPLEAHSPPQLDEDEDEQLEAHTPSDEAEPMEAYTPSDEVEPMDEDETLDEENPEVMNEKGTAKVFNMKEALTERICEKPGKPVKAYEEQQLEYTAEEDADRPARVRGTKVRAGRKVQGARVLAEIQRLAREMGVSTAEAMRGVMDADTGKGKGKGKGKHKDASNNSGKRGYKGKHGCGDKGGKHNRHGHGGYWVYTGP